MYFSAQLSKLNIIIMLLPLKIKSIFTAFALTILFVCPTYLNAQQGSYRGNEAKLSKSEILLKTKSLDFGDNISAEIYKDEKNTYYAVDISKLSSKYEKIRLLELSFADKALVNIGSDSSTGYYFFLVNNTLSKSSEEINKLFTGYLVKSQDELKLMNEEQLRLWLIQHDKYSKK